LAERRVPAGYWRSFLRQDDREHASAEGAVALIVRDLLEEVPAQEYELPKTLRAAKL
jgi:hypothetical protein